MPEPSKPKTDPKATRHHLDRLAWLLDSSIRVPGTDWRVGIDGIIGLIPGVGDAAGAVLSSYILAQAARMGVPKTTLMRMGFNVAIDTVIGMIPLAGDIFDMAWKANLRNVRLLNAYMAEPRRVTTTSRLLVFGLSAVLIAFILAMLVLAILIVRWLVEAIAN